MAIASLSTDRSRRRALTASGPARRIVLATAIVIPLLAGTAAISAWRFEHAISAKDVALHAHAESAYAVGAELAFWRERQAMNEYLIDRDPALLNELRGQAAAFENSLRGLGGAQDAPGKQAFVSKARTGNRVVLAEFDELRRIAGGGTRAIGRLQSPEAAVTSSLDRLRAIYRAEIPVRLAEARAARHEAILAAIGGAVLASLGALLFAWYALGLVGRLDLVIGRVRSTSSVLSTVANELRAAAQESASATTEQSSAVAQTSATVEQLAVTATSIADNARAVASAAEQTGDTMRDMQEKVETIATRSLALGERSQKIGEILALIDTIAEQTNLLALNAAIEAARAGDAGKGFAVVASEVRKLAERSMASSDSIKQIIAGVQDETNATIMATEQGTKQARHVADLMTSTADMVEESILATQQQKSAADQVATAIVQIRESADQLAAETQQRAGTAEQVESLVAELEAMVASEARAGAAA
jgi:methyl-accepting chemotaxis protein-like sensor